MEYFHIHSSIFKHSNTDSKATADESILRKKIYSKMIFRGWILRFEKYTRN